MIDPAISDDSLSKLVRDALTKQAEKIVDEEAERAQHRVVERINELKTTAIANILTRFKITSHKDFGRMSLVIETEI